MSFERVDGYLLGEPISKAEAVSALLAQRVANPAAQPFYRALEAVRERAADEALVALRLVIAGRPADDDAVRRVRAVAAIARAARQGDRRSVRRTLERDAAVLRDLAEDPPETLGERARAAFESAVRGAG